LKPPVARRSVLHAALTVWCARLILPRHGRRTSPAVLAKKPPHDPVLFMNYFGWFLIVGAFILMSIGFGGQHRYSGASYANLLASAWRWQRSPSYFTTNLTSDRRRSSTSRTEQKSMPHPAKPALCLLASLRLKEGRFRDEPVRAISPTTFNLIHSASISSSLRLPGVQWRFVITSHTPSDRSRAHSRTTAPKVHRT
jgi:hypothetical protein